MSGTASVTAEGSYEWWAAEVARLKQVLAERTAELAAAEARAEHAEGELSSRRYHNTRWELERARADKAEAALERVRRAVIDTYGEDYAGEDTASEVERLFRHLGEHEANVQRILQAKNTAIERAQAERAEIKRVTEPPVADETPSDPAELREMWDFINRQSRWQHHMAQKFFRGREQAEAAIERVRAQHRQDDPYDPMCRHCGMTWPCPTIRVLSAPEPHAPATP
jgi:chromosome segregation ATPase